MSDTIHILSNCLVYKQTFAVLIHGLIKSVSDEGKKGTGGKTNKNRK